MANQDARESSLFHFKLAHNIHVFFACAQHLISCSRLIFTLARGLTSIDTFFNRINTEKFFKRVFTGFSA
jgi:hypothetical protein